MAAHLNGKEREEWEEAQYRLDRCEVFRSEDGRLWERLVISYDGLSLEEKELFLDISCAMYGMNKEHALSFWRKT